MLSPADRETLERELACAEAAVDVAIKDDDIAWDDFQAIVDRRDELLDRLSQADDTNSNKEQ